MNFMNDMSSVLINQRELDSKIEELGKLLTEEYEGKRPIAVCILKGSTIFYSDLLRKMNCEVQMDFIIASSYVGTKSSREVVIKKDLENDINGRHVLLVEDIIDSGNTLFCLKQELLKRNPASLKIVTLMNKQARREVDISADWFGFDIPDEFVVGFGLDYNEKYRNVPFVGVLKHEIYDKSCTESR